MVACLGCCGQSSHMGGFTHVFNALTPWRSEVQSQFSPGWNQIVGSDALCSVQALGGVWLPAFLSFIAIYQGFIAASWRALFLYYQTPKQSFMPSASVSFFSDKISISICPLPILRTLRMVFVSTWGQLPHASILNHACKGPLACRGVYPQVSGETGCIHS